MLINEGVGDTLKLLTLLQNKGREKDSISGDRIAEAFVETFYLIFTSISVVEGNEKGSVKDSDGDNNRIDCGEICGDLQNVRMTKNLWII